MIQQLLIYIAIALLLSLVFAVLTLIIDQGAVKLKNTKGLSKAISWVFLFPIFDSFLKWYDKLGVKLYGQADLYLNINIKKVGFAVVIISVISLMIYIFLRSHSPRVTP